MAGMEFSLRRYKASDQPDVLELHQVALHAAGAHAGSGPWDNDLYNIEEVYLENEGEFIVGLIGDRLVAMGALVRDSSERAKISRMRVHPDHQRRSFGQVVLSALETRAAKLGYVELHLDTTVQQEAAQSLYIKNGYREAHRGRMLGFDCIFYEKAIDPAQPSLSTL